MDLKPTKKDIDNYVESGGNLSILTRDEIKEISRDSIEIRAQKGERLNGLENY